MQDNQNFNKPTLPLSRRHFVLGSAAAAAVGLMMDDRATAAALPVKSTVSTFTAITVPTQFVETNGIRFAYRRWGKKGQLPLVFNQHFTGNLDNWDPAVLDGLAQEREVIIFNNAGIASSTGEVPSTFAGMGKNAELFIDALGLKQVDLLGFSIGGMVAQQIVVDRPELVRKLILVGSAPRNLDAGGGAGYITPETASVFGAS
jgi:pimeloyl-ACP methyl ester carboxylesterase